MGIAELFLVLIVALLVLKPKQLPSLIKHITRLLGKARSIKTDIEDRLDEEFKQDVLEKNNKKAEIADKQYQQHDK